MAFARSDHRDMLRRRISETRARLPAIRPRCGAAIADIVRQHFGFALVLDLARPAEALFVERRKLLAETRSDVYSTWKTSAHVSA